MSLLLAASAESQAGQFGSVTAGDYIYVGADEPFWGIVFEMLVANAGATLPFQAIEYSTATGWTGITGKDSTMALSRDGCVAVLPTSDVVATGLWVKQTVDSDSKYWIRLKPDNTMTSTQVADVFIAPYRPGLDSLYRFTYTAQALAGALPQILVGTWRGEEMIWQHLWTLEAAEVMQLLTSRARGPSSMGRLNLWAWCQDAVYQMAIGPEAHPARAFWPPTNAEMHVIWASGWDFGGVAQVDMVEIETEFLQADDELWLYWRWDNEPGWRNNGPIGQGPILTSLNGHGRVLYLAVALDDATRDAVAPQVLSVEILSEAEGGWRRLGGPIPREQDIASPQLR